MKEVYDATNLIVAQLQRISNDYDSCPKIETTKQKYIFEKINEKNNIKYREIFTGFITERIDNTRDDYNSKIFDFPYIFNPKKFTDYIPETEEMKIPKLSLIWAQNDINYSNKKCIVKVKKLNKR